MKHFNFSNWKTPWTPVKGRDQGSTFCLPEGVVETPNPRAVAYRVTAASVRTFGTSGYPFLTFYEFGDLVGWYRDTYFAPDHVANYASDIGQTYAVWTHEVFAAYRRHVLFDEMPDDVLVTFEVPFLTSMSWFPLRVCVVDQDGLYFQMDQKLVVERLSAGKGAITSWKKIPVLREGLPLLHELTRARG